MRRESTRAEIYLWQQVRGRQLAVRFRRQEPIGPFIVYFVCLSKKLIIEVDGDSHNYRDQAYAERREEWFRTRGWTVLHFTERYVLDNIDGTLAVINHVLTDPAAASRYVD